MSLINVSNLTFSYEGSYDNIFENVSFQIDTDWKLGFIGRNGRGKTTFLNLLLGKYAYSGNISSTVKFEYFPYDVEDKSLYTIEVMKSICTECMDWEIFREISLLDVQEDALYRPFNTLSNGEQTKVLLAALFLTASCFLLIDEPTNHLDLKTIEWLENYLSKYKKDMVIVSHDRVFLDKVCNVTYELEYGNLKRYGGNYTYFTEQKKNDLLKQEAAYKRQQKDIKRLEELIEKFRYKKNKAAFAQSKIKYLERMERIEDPRKADTKTFNARFVCDKRGGKNVLSLQDYEVGYNNKPLIKLNLEIQRGDRICIMGDNGTGKSTLLKSIIDEIPAISGYKMLGHQIEIGYFDQNMAQFTSGNTVLEELWNEHPEMDMYEVRSVLGAFLFTADEVFKEVNVLSGGEKVRLNLAKLMLKKANFLILDEPTNHLDILCKEALEKCLREYDGTILFVSHDRYFIKQIATSVLNIENGTAVLYPDGYKDYIDVKVKEEVKPQKKEEEPKEKLKDIKQRPKYSIKKLEEEISQMEELLEEKRDLRYEPEYYQDSRKMQELDEEIDDIHNQIHALEVKWEEAMLFEEARKSS